MSYSEKTYTADGSTIDFTVTFSYLDQDHIEVYVDGVSTAAVGSAYKFEWTSATTVRVRTVVGEDPVPNGATILIKRSTPIDTPAVVFASGSSLTSTKLNDSVSYLTFALQELSDNAPASSAATAAAASAAAAAASALSAASAEAVAPSSLQILVMSDGQPLHASSSDNTHGHDQIAVWRSLLDGVATNFPAASWLFHCGDVVDEGAQRDIGTDPEYALSDWIGDVYSRLPMPLHRVAAVAGNHDNNYGQLNDQEFGRTFYNARRYLAPGYYYMDIGSIRTVHMSDYYPGTNGSLPKHVRDWFSRVVFEANSQGKIVMVFTHQPLDGTGLLVGTGTSSVHADSAWFLNLIQEPGYKVSAWFSGHAGDESDGADGPNYVQFNDTYFFNANMRIPGAYNAASGVPLSDLHYWVIDFTADSSTVTIRHWNDTAGDFYSGETVTFNHDHALQLAHDPQFDGRFQYDGRHGIVETLLPGQHSWVVGEHPRENDVAGEVTLGANPLDTTVGSKTVVVTDAAHGFSDGKEVRIYGADSVGGIPAANINGTRRITVIDAGSYSIEAGVEATSTATGGGSSVKRNAAWTTLASEPFYALRVGSYIGRGPHVVGQSVGMGLYVPYATANSGAGEGTDDENADDLAVGFGFGGSVDASLIDLATRACSLRLSASSGPQKSDRVDVVELHPTDGPKAIVGSFQYQVPSFSITDNSNIDLATAAATLYPSALGSVDHDTGSDLNTTTGEATGEAGEVWEYTATVQFSSNTGTDTMRVDLEAGGSTIFAKAIKQLGAAESDNAITVTGIYRFPSTQTVKIKITGHNGSSTQDVNWITWVGKRIATGT